MQALEPHIISGWVQHMRQCAGLSAEPAWHGGDRAPRVLFVNRAVKSGRSVLPMGQVGPSQCQCAPLICVFSLVHHIVRLRKTR